MPTLTPELTEEFQDEELKEDPLCEVDHDHDCTIFAAWYYKSFCGLDRGYACETAHLQFVEWADQGVVTCEYCGAQGGDHWVWTPVGA